MSEIIIDSPSNRATPLSIDVRILLLFCLFGLAISAAILPLFTPDDVSWVVSHIE